MPCDTIALCGIALSAVAHSRLQANKPLVLQHLLLQVPRVLLGCQDRHDAVDRDQHARRLRRRHDRLYRPLRMRVVGDHGLRRLRMLRVHDLVLHERLFLLLLCVLLLAVSLLAGHAELMPHVHLYAWCAEGRCEGLCLALHLLVRGGHCGMVRERLYKHNTWQHTRPHMHESEACRKVRSDHA